ncbi:MAG: hypothetical protein ACI8R4_001464 [Paracoccaceae bacterium]|jgi:hypothetical protein
MSYAQVQTLAAKAGLLTMGALHPDRTQAKGLTGGTLILLGAATAFWPVFTASPEVQDGQPDPIDRWSTRVVGDLATHLNARAYYPFGGPPYTPFIDWALKSGRAFSSPTGMMVHDRVGLLISYRGALHFADPFDIPTATATAASPCDSCADQPCTTACPVAALNATAAYDLTACHTYLDTPPGQSCMIQGCAARLACPLSAGAGRHPNQSAQHMKAFHPT